ncbi:hypothetical protein ACIA8K_36380 [Catenuloplanes sp. NPDC051500]|uniref:hypothetical protein n=1 Tax=Catenuloplanes sp. NPDC051500 TaxID=3363959 RepID=UPI0037BC1124
MRRLPFVVIVLALGGCARTDMLHGQISQLTPSVCVAAEEASGQCFTPGHGAELFRGYEVGDCVYLRYKPETEGRPPETGSIPLVATEVKPAPCEEDWHPPVDAPSR